MALPLHLPTAPSGGHMGHFLLSVPILTGATPFGNMASLSVELNSNYLVQDKPHNFFHTCTRHVMRSQEITIGHVPDRAMPADFLTKWIGASKLNVSVEHVTNSRHAPKRPAEQSMNGLGGVLDGRLGPDDCIRSGT